MCLGGHSSQRDCQEHSEPSKSWRSVGIIPTHCWAYTTASTRLFSLVNG